MEDNHLKQLKEFYKLVFESDQGKQVMSESIIGLIVLHRNNVVKRKRIL